MAFTPENQVRTGLPAGGSGIRTTGPSRVEYLCFDWFCRLEGWKKPVQKSPPSWGDRQFESVFLQRRVSLTGVFGGSRRKSPAFAGSMSLDVTRERDVLARSRLALAPFL